MPVGEVLERTLPSCGAWARRGGTGAPSPGVTPVVRSCRAGKRVWLGFEVQDGCRVLPVPGERRHERHGPDGRPAAGSSTALMEGGAAPRPEVVRSYIALCLLLFFPPVHPAYLARFLFKLSFYALFESPLSF